MPQLPPASPYCGICHCHCWSPRTRSLCSAQGKPPKCGVWKVASNHCNQRKPEYSNKDPVQPKKEKKTHLFKWELHRDFCCCFPWNLGAMTIPGLMYYKSFQKHLVNRQNVSHTHTHTKGNQKHLILDFPAFRTLWESKCLSFISQPSPQNCVKTAWMDEAIYQEIKIDIIREVTWVQHNR